MIRIISLRSRLTLSRRGRLATNCSILTFGRFGDLLPRRASSHWLDNLGGDDELLLNQEHACIILSGAAVVSAGSNGD